MELSSFVDRIQLALRVGISSLERIARCGSDLTRLAGRIQLALWIGFNSLCGSELARFCESDLARFYGLDLARFYRPD
ncbi:hypothetical protein J6590_059542 [Homalodisca vitripennis]|nr:hypothetical protein J6590_059542 [Homalodisca vitripennis]